MDAMWMVTKAWCKVTESTISNCLKKSGFKVTTENEDDSEQPPTQAAKIPESWEKVKEALNLQDAYFEDFITLEDNIAVCGELTNAEIISSLTSVPDENAEENSENEEQQGSEIPDPTLKDPREALNALKRLFLKKGGLSDSVVKSIAELDCALDMVNITTSKQTTITDFFCKRQEENSPDCVTENHDLVQNLD